MPVFPSPETPAQTAGPYVHIGLAPGIAGLPVRRQGASNVVFGASATGERIRIEGVVYDGAGVPVRDALLELRQADSHGRAAACGGGFGRAAADPTTGAWRFETVKPGVTRNIDGQAEAPFATILIFARGINLHLHTRVYFADEADANARDPALRAAGAGAIRLIAPREDGPDGPVCRFDVHLQGASEAPFSDV